MIKNKAVTKKVPVKKLSKEAQLPKNIHLEQDYILEDGSVFQEKQWTIYNKKRNQEKLSIL